MGGFGSGRQWQGGKNTTSDMRGLDVRQLQRRDCLTPGRSYGWHWTRYGAEAARIDIRAESGRVVLSYRTRSDGDEWQRVEYPVMLTWTDCNLGGRRAWFLCPARGCGRRVAILYGGAVFACRHCHRLVYDCQRETNDDRAARRADNIRARLGWAPGILNGDCPKPKGMHWRTYWRLYAEHDAYVSKSLVGIAVRFGMLNAKLGALPD